MVRRPNPGVAEEAKLFKHGGSQAVRLPKAFRFEGDRVHIRKEGDKVILEPVEKRPPTREEIRAWFERIHAPDFPDDIYDDPPPKDPPWMLD